MTRLAPEHRHDLILDAAVDAAQAMGLYDFQLVDVAERANCSRPLIVHYFTSLMQLRTAVIEKAKTDKHHAILAQALTNKDPAVVDLPLALKRKALMSVVQP